MNIPITICVWSINLVHATGKPGIFLLAQITPPTLKVPSALLNTNLYNGDDDDDDGYDDDGDFPTRDPYNAKYTQKTSNRNFGV